MNIKRISRVMVIALSLSIAGSVFANDKDGTNNNDVSQLNTVPNLTKQYWYVPTGVGIAAGLVMMREQMREHWYVPTGIGIAAGLIIWKYMHDKKVKQVEDEQKKEKAAKEAAQKKHVEQQRQAELAAKQCRLAEQQRRNAANAHTRRMQRRQRSRCSGGMCRIR